MSTTTDRAALTAAALDGSTGMLQWALFHAALGWPVVPVIPGGKHPAVPDHVAGRCRRRDPRCAHGHVGWEARASTDPDRIRRAWSRTRFNIGLACGPAGLVVIDCDTDPDRGQPGAAVLAEMAAQRGVQLPATYTVTTPSGGQHLYFRAPPGVQLRNTRGDLGPNLDTRAHGGLVVAAGSVRPDGTYVLADDTDPAELPAWILQALHGRAATASTAPAVRPLPSPTPTPPPRCAARPNESPPPAAASTTPCCPPPPGASASSPAPGCWTPSTPAPRCAPPPYT